VVTAILRTINARPAYLVDYESRPDGNLRARIRTPDPGAEADLRAWTEGVAAELRSAGYCAYSGDPNGRSPDEILIQTPAGAEQYDLAQCGAGFPEDRYCVGMDIWTQPFDCTVEAGGGGGPSPLPSPPPPDQVCTAAGITEGGELKRFPSLQAACSERLAVTVAQGHLEAHVSGGEPWYRDTGMGGGWYDARCDRYDSPGGRKLAGPEWFGVRCEP